MDKIYCTAESPWNGVKTSDLRVTHSDTREVGERQDGMVVIMECKNCGHKWRVELPQ